MTKPLVEVRNLRKVYQSKQGLLRRGTSFEALKGVSFTVAPGETLAVVGESGCGKSTLARIITLIDTATAGEFSFAGQPINILDNKNSKDLRQQIQIVFQNPYGSLNPRQKIGDVLEEPLKLNTNKTAQERRQLALEMLEKVGLNAEHYHRYPHMFSGGQRQRIAIARSLMLTPKLLVLDEPVSALDLSVQAQILKLLAELQRDLNLTYIFISHDLSVVKSIADNVLVMYQGECVEYAPASTIFMQPQHAYTQSLFAATPVIDLSQIRQRVSSR